MDRQLTDQINRHFDAIIFVHTLWSSHDSFCNISSYYFHYHKGNHNHDTFIFLLSSYPLLDNHLTLISKSHQSLLIPMSCHSQSMFCECDDQQLCVLSRRYLSISVARKVLDPLLRLLEGFDVFIYMTWCRARMYRNRLLSRTVTWHYYYCNKIFHGKFQYFSITISKSSNNLSEDVSFILTPSITRILVLANSRWRCKNHWTHWVPISSYITNCMPSLLTCLTRGFLISSVVSGSAASRGG